MEKPFLTISHVEKSFGETSVLKDINLEIKEKEIVVLLGPSGCGKTTLLRIISGLLDANSGSIMLEGEDLMKKPVHERQIGFVFQKYALFPNMNVEDNILFGLKLRKVPKAEMKERLEEVLELVELKGYEKRRISELSGGQQQRVSLARAIIIRPKLMLLDEPLSNLDAKLRANVRVNIVRILKKMGITAIMVTHDQIEAMTMGDRVVLMNHGIIQQDAEPKEIYNNPNHLFVAEFLGTPKMNSFSMELLEGGTFSLGGKIFQRDVLSSWCQISDPKKLPAGNYTLGVRPENIILSDASDNTFPAYVNLVEICGADTNIHANMIGGDYVFRVNSATTDLHQGDTVSVSFLQKTSFLFDEAGERVL